MNDGKYGLWVQTSSLIDVMLLVSKFVVVCVIPSSRSSLSSA